MLSEQIWPEDRERETCIVFAIHEHLDEKISNKMALFLLACKVRVNTLRRFRSLFVLLLLLVLFFC